jgi:hypothetical protein
MRVAGGRRLHETKGGVVQVFSKVGDEGELRQVVHCPHHGKLHDRPHLSPADGRNVVQLSRGGTMLKKIAEFLTLRWLWDRR